MLRAFFAGCPFWTRANGCAPADETTAKWFFDKSVWQKLFKTMSGCGYDTVVFESDGCREFGEDIRAMHHWILGTALDYEIAPMLSLACRSGDADLAKNTHSMVDEYTEIAGILLHSFGADRAGCAVALDVIDAVRPDAAVWLRVGELEPADVSALARRGGRRITYIVEYCRKGLLDYNPDSAFRRWADAVDHSEIIAEVSPANFQPWTSFSYDTITGALDQMDGMELGGFVLGSISPSDWPRTSDTGFKYQWQRDLIWLYTWAGEDLLEMVEEGKPKWLKRNQKLVSGFSSGSRVLELTGLYLWPNNAQAWFPQFCARRTGDNWLLLSLADLLSSDLYSPESGKSLWEELTGERPQSLAQHLSGVGDKELYGVEEFLGEIGDLSDLALEAAEKGMRNDSGEKELPFLCRDAFCCAKLGKFWVSRVSAALAYGRDNQPEALQHAEAALEEFQELVRLDSTHRGQFPVAWNDEVIQVEWGKVVAALEAELADIRKGEFKPGEEYRVF